MGVDHVSTATESLTHTAQVRSPVLHTVVVMSSRSMAEMIPGTSSTTSPSSRILRVWTLARPRLMPPWAKFL